MTWRARLAAFAGVLACGALGVLLYRMLVGHEFRVHVGGEQWVLSAPERLSLCAGWPLLAAASWFGLADHLRAQRMLSLLSRSLLMFVLSLTLSRPAHLHDTRRVSLVFAADVSDSIDAGELGRERSFIARACAMSNAKPCKLIEFASSAHALGKASQLRQAWQPHSAELRETNLQAAIQLAYGLHTERHARRVVVLSDGKQTRGDLALEAARAARMGVELDYVALTSPPPDEVGVVALTVPHAIDVGRPFHLLATLFSSSESDVKLQLFQADLPAPLITRDAHLSAGETTLELPALTRVSGPLAYTLVLTPHGSDQFSENNRASAAGFAHGRPRVLWVDGDPSRLMAASSALQQHGFEVEARLPVAMPRTAAELGSYDFFILSDVDADRLPAASFELIERYVRDRGGGFMMVGGDHSFGLGGYQRTRLAKLLPVQMAGEIHRDDHSLALALLIDCSGSMAGAKIDLAKEAARASVEVLADEDLIEVVGFAGEPERQVRLQSARNRAAVMQNIARLIAEGGTQLFPALDLAYQDLALAHARVKHVILLTDGQTQESGIPEIIQAMRAENITVSTVGLGRDVNRELLQMSASMGGGRAYFTDDPRNVPRIFVHETTSQKQNDAVEQPTHIHVREAADFMRGIDIAQAPALRGYVATQAKPHPAQVLLESDTGEPLLARVHVGLGFALAFTPDLKARWSADFMRWPEFANFFAQLLREHLRKTDSDELPMHVEVDHDSAHVSVDAIGGDQRFVHGLTSEVEWLVPAAASRRVAALREVAPGRYEVTLALPGYGTYALKATHSLHGQSLGESHAQAQNPYPLEYRPGPSNVALLEHMAKQTGGRALRESDEASAWRPSRKAVTVREELWPYGTWLALALFLLDLLLRRVQIFDRSRVQSRVGGASST